MKYDFKTSIISIVSVLCVTISMPAFAASSVRSLGGAGTYSSAASAANAKGGSVSSNTGASTASVGATRGGAMRVGSGADSLANTRVSSARAATSPRLSIGRYLAGASSVGSSVSKPITPGGSSSDNTEIINNIEDIKSFVGFGSGETIVQQLDGLRQQLENVDDVEYDGASGTLSINGTEVNLSDIQDLTDLENRLDRIEAVIDGLETDLESTVAGYVNTIVDALLADRLAAKADKTELVAKADKTELADKADKTDLAAKADKSELDALSERVDNLNVSGGLEAPTGTGLHVYDAGKQAWETLTVVGADDATQTNGVTNN